MKQLIPSKDAYQIVLESVKSVEVSWEKVKLEDSFGRVLLLHLTHRACQGFFYCVMRLCGRGEPMPFFNPLLLAVAGLCDMTATSMMCAWRRG